MRLYHIPDCSISASRGGKWAEQYFDLMLMSNCMAFSRSIYWYMTRLCSDTYLCWCTTRTIVVIIFLVSALPVLITQTLPKSLLRFDVRWDKMIVFYLCFKITLTHFLFFITCCVCMCVGRWGVRYCFYCCHCVKHFVLLCCMKSAIQIECVWLIDWLNVSHSRMFE